MKAVVLAWVVSALGGLAIGCSSSAGVTKSPKVEVTTRAELEKALAKDVPEVSYPEVEQIEEFAFVGPLPDRIGSAAIRYTIVVARRR